MFVSTNAKFLENDYMNDYTPRSRVFFVEMNEPVNEQPINETRDEMSSIQVPHHSGRIVRPPIRFIGLGETYEAILEETETDPYTYEEVMKDIDAHHGVKVMKSKLDSMYSNQAWDLVKVSNGTKPIGCKWLYKRKRGIDGKVETFKIRLVTKWYT